MNISEDPLPLLESCHTLTDDSLGVPLDLPLPVRETLLALFHGFEVDDIQVSTYHCFKYFLPQRVVILQLFVISLFKLPPSIPALVEPLPPNLVFRESVVQILTGLDRTYYILILSCDPTLARTWADSRKPSGMSFLQREQVARVPACLVRPLAQR